jgi:YidC/Oxa1 family membrane protein insertase
MDRNTILGLVLIFALFIGYSWWSAPSKEELEAKRKTQDSLALVQMQTDSTTNVARSERKSSDSIAAAADSLQNTPEMLNDKLGFFANAAKGEDKNFIIENEVLKLSISSKGGRIAQAQLKEFRTFDSIPLLLFTKDSSEFYLEFFSNNRNINTGELYFQPVYSNPSLNGKEKLSVKGNDSLKFAMRLYASASDTIANPTKYIEFAYTIYGNSYMIGFNINFVGMKDIIAANANFIDLKWNSDIRRQEKNAKNENIVSSVFYKLLKDDVDYLSETKDDETSLKTPVKWISFTQQFFSTTLIAKDQFLNADIKSFTEKHKEGGRYLKSLRSLIGIPYQSSADNSVAMNMYMGPNKYKILKGYDLELERQIPLGWSFFLLQWINRYAVIPVFNILDSLNWNYGIIILVLTIILKVVLLPIAYKSYLSTAKMKVLKPEIEEISAKFPKKEQAMDKQKATMALYKKAGVNPMAGCVPMLLQFPILIALFRFFPASIELRQQPFLWAEDLSSYDSIINLGIDIPFYGDHVSLFALLMAASNLLYTKMNMESMGSTNSMPGMKTMMYIMPVMFLGFLNSYSSGLNYYYFLSTMFTFGQMYLIRQFVNEDKIHAKIQENKKKPVVKSKFQQRIEDMAKQRGYGSTPAKKK